MAIEPGSRIGPYEVITKLGAGGMGEVYRAKDSGLKREVAIKVLPAEVAGDGERLARFQREAEVLASLNHPNIAHVYGIERQPPALIMELVDGDDLAQRLSRGPLPADEALPIARQIAEALEAAHERGIIHRDLKPANVKVRADGTVKVLDFGLAKALDQGLNASTPHGLENSPTITTPAMTMRGVILGTAAYMSPEQAKGKAVDRRADVWAFGCVLYEMLSGKKAFDGEDVTDTLTSVMRDTPDWKALPPALPASIHRLLRRCIEKDVRKRAAHMSIARLEIEDAMSGGDGTPRAEGLRHRRGRGLAAMIAGVVGALIAGVTIGWMLRTPPASDAAPVSRFTIEPPADTKGTFLVAIPSPDESHIALPPTGDGGVAERIFVRRMDGGAPIPLAGTEGARGVSWAPDSKSIVFMTGGELKRADVSGGLVRTIARIDSLAFATAESSLGPILVGTASGPLHVIRNEGATAEPLAPLDKANGEFEQQAPVFLPDGRRFLYASIRGSGDLAAVTRLRTIDEAATEEIKGFDGRVVWANDEFVIFRRDTALLAQRIQYSPLQLIGDPVQIAADLPILPVGARQAMASATRHFVSYRTDALTQQQLTWIGRNGGPSGSLGPQGRYNTFDMSADGTQVIVSRQEGMTANLWLVDTAKGTMNRVTAARLPHVDPRFGPDGRSVIFGNTGDSGRSPHRVNLTADTPQQVFAFGGRMFSNDDWSPDGQWLLYHDAFAPLLQASRLDRPGDAPLTVVKALSGIIDQAQFSNDGRWVAYNSNESGTTEVYVVPFPPTGERWQVSAGGGAQPQWRRDGRELYYLRPDRALMAVSITTAPRFAAKDPVRLFEARITNVQTGTEQYVVSPDGSRFLFVLPISAGRTAPTIVLSNWMALLRPTAAGQ